MGRCSPTSPAQCGGSPGQRWQFSGATGALTSTGTGICAVAGRAARARHRHRPRERAPGSPGGAPAARRLRRFGHGRRWPGDVRRPALELRLQRRHGRRPGQAAARPEGAFTAALTVANAASAQAAYGVSIRLGLPRGVTLSALRSAASAAGWRCNVRALTCSGDLPAGVAERVGISGRLPATARRGTAVDALRGCFGRRDQPVARDHPGRGARPGDRARRRTARHGRPGRAGPGYRRRAHRGARSPGLCCSAVACWSPWPGGTVPDPGEAPERQGRKRANKAARNRAGRRAAQPPDDPDVVDVTHLVDITEIIEVTNVTSDDWRGRPGDPAPPSRSTWPRAGPAIPPASAAPPG